MQSTINAQTTRAGPALASFGSQSRTRTVITHNLPTHSSSCPTFNPHVFESHRRSVVQTTNKKQVVVSRPAFSTIKTTSTISTQSRRRLTISAATTADAPAPVLPFRVGHGWDLHRLEPGYPLIIGGIDIPHDRGCVAHSDGDVLLHTVVDAILGALALPDIGQLFPDNDPKWKGARSDIFLKEAVRLMKEAGYTIGNIDCTIIAQRPKLSPHKETIRANLCEMLEAHPSVVIIKAKTHEKVDSLGENRSISCHAVVILLRN